MSKTLYCIRHGTALHNINFPKMGRKAYTEFHDTPLVDYGHLESTTFGQNWFTQYDIELVVTSPLTRTIQTAKNIFIAQPNIHIIALDCLKEHPQSEEWCNSRQSLSILMKKYPFIDFSEIKDDKDIIWQKKRLSDEVELTNLHGRIDELKKWILNRPEKTIAVIGHSSFFGEMLFNKMGDEDSELQHCCPYIYKL